MVYLDIFPLEVLESDLFSRKFVDIFPLSRRSAFITVLLEVVPGTGTRYRSPLISYPSQTMRESL